jgi:periplasmic protein TonB
MTSTTKNPSDQDVQNKPGESPRSNPVCLEANVTLRSLPTEANGQTQPIREDLKTVIVFDNGAVLRSTNNLPAGMTLILSNASARDVVCRVVTGRSMPSVKGYVEVEFMEPVKDFWGIHQEGMQAISSTPAAAPPALKAPAPPAPVRPAQPAAIPPSVTPPASQETTARPVTPPLRSVPAVEPPSRPASAALTGTPEFDEFPAPTGSMSSHAARVSNEPKPAPPPSPAPPMNARAIAEKPVMEYSHSETANSTSVGNWTAPEPEPPAAKAEFKPPQEPLDAVSSTPVPTRDFMSKGLMAYQQPAASTGASAGRTPLLLGVAALVLAGVCGVVFFLHRNSGPAPVASAAVANTTAASQPATPNSPAAPAAVPSTHESAPPAPAAQSEPPQAQAIAAQPVQPSVAVAPIPSAEIANAPAPESRADSRSARRQDNSVAAAKQAVVAAPKRPMLSNLQMSAPSAPSKNIGDAGDGAAPVAEIASADLPAGSTPATLLSSSGRTAGQPAPPPAPAPPLVKTVTDPKLISSTRPVYPLTARQSNIEGSVTVVIYIDPAGKVFSARALSGPVMLRAAAEEAVKQWKYSPSLEDGKPVQSHVVVKVDFKIN